MQESISQPMVQNIDYDLEKLIQILWELKEKNFIYNSTTICPTNTTSQSFATFKKEENGLLDLLGVTPNNLVTLLSQTYNEGLNSRMDIAYFNFMIKILSSEALNEEEFKKMYQEIESIKKTLSDYIDIASTLLDIKNKSNDEIVQELKQRTDTVSQLLFSRIVGWEKYVGDLKNNLISRPDLPQLLDVFFSILRKGKIEIIPRNILANCLRKNLYMYSFNSNTNSYTYVRHMYHENVETIYTLEENKHFLRLIPTKGFIIQPIWRKIQEANSTTELDRTELKKYFSTHVTMEVSDYCHIDKLPDELKTLLITFLLPKDAIFLEKTLYLSLSALSKTNKNFNNLIQNNGALWRAILYKIYEIKYGFLVEKPSFIPIKEDPLNTAYRSICIKELTGVLKQNEYLHLLELESKHKAKNELIPLNPYLPLIIARNHYNCFVGTDSWANIAETNHATNNVGSCFKFALVAINNGNQSAWFLLYYLYLSTISTLLFRNFETHLGTKNLMKTFNKELLSYFNFNEGQINEALYKKCFDLVTKDLDEVAIIKIKEKFKELLKQWLVVFAFNKFEPVKKIFIEACISGNDLIDSQTLDDLISSNTVEKALNIFPLEKIQSLSKTGIGKEFLRCLTDYSLTDKDRKYLGDFILNLGAGLIIPLHEAIKLIIQTNGKDLFEKISLSSQTFLHLLTYGDIELRKTRIQLLSNDFFLPILEAKSLHPILLHLTAYDITRLLLDKELQNIFATTVQLNNILNNVHASETIDVNDLLLLSNNPNVVKQLTNTPSLLTKCSLKGVCYLYSKTSLFNESGIKLILSILARSSLIVDSQLKLIDYLERIAQYPSVIELLKMFANIHIKSQPYNMFLDFFRNGHLEQLISQSNLITDLVNNENDLLQSKNDIVEMQRLINAKSLEYTVPNNSLWNIPHLLSILIYSPKILQAVKLVELLKIYPFRYRFLSQIKPNSFQHWKIKEIKIALTGSKNSLTKELVERLQPLPELLTITCSFKELDEILESPIFEALKESNHWKSVLKYYSFAEIFKAIPITLNKIFWMYDKNYVSQKSPTNYLVDILFAAGSEPFWNNLLSTTPSLSYLKEVIEKNETIEILLLAPPQVNELLSARFTLTQLENLNHIIKLMTSFSLQYLTCILSLYSYEQLVALSEEDTEVIKCISLLTLQVYWSSTENTNRWQMYKQFFSQKDEHSITLAKKLLSSKYTLGFMQELSLLVENPLELFESLLKESFLSNLIPINNFSQIYILKSLNNETALSDTVKFYRLAYNMKLTDDMTLLQWIITTENVRTAKYLFEAGQEILSDKNFLEIITSSNPKNLIFNCFSNAEIRELYATKVVYKGQEVSFLKILLAESTEEYLNLFKGWTLLDLKTYIQNDLKKDYPRLPSIIQTFSDPNKNNAIGHKRKRTYFFNNKEEEKSSPDESEVRKSPRTH